MHAGKLVQLAGAGHLFKHVTETGAAAYGICKSLRFDHEFRKFDVVERTHTVGQLNPRLKGGVAPSGGQCLPLPCALHTSLDRKQLGADPACGWQGRQSGITRHSLVHFDRRQHVDQCVQMGLAIGLAQVRESILQHWLNGIGAVGRNSGVGVQHRLDGMQSRIERRLAMGVGLARRVFA